MKYFVVAETYDDEGLQESEAGSHTLPILCTGQLMKLRKRKQI